jgi:positive regulator of sigma E activity
MERTSNYGLVPSVPGVPNANKTACSDPTAIGIAAIGARVAVCDRVVLGLPEISLLRFSGLVLVLATKTLFLRSILSRTPAARPWIDGHLPTYQD